MKKLFYCFRRRLLDVFGFISIQITQLRRGIYQQPTHWQKHRRTHIELIVQLISRFLSSAAFLLLSATSTETLFTTHSDSKAIKCRGLSYGGRAKGEEENSH